MQDKQLQAILKLKDEFSRPLKEINSVLKDFKREAENVKKANNNLSESMKSTSKATLKIGATISAITGGVLIGAANAAINFESAFAGVIKTVDATDTQLEVLRQGILDMSSKMPQAATDIAAVAEVAGQLGIQTDNILGFTEAMIMLGDSTNMSSETAAMELARFANITKMSQNDFDKLGSTIVDLGNNLATTESDISSMALRLAGAGTQVGLTEAQILSFAGALSSVGIEAEMGGSAFSKIMVEIQSAVEGGGEALSDFANVAGMSSKEFSNAFKTNAAGALIAFLKGIQDTERHGKSAIGVLNDLGVEEVRLRDTLLRASSAHDLFNNAIDIGTNAWKENNALMKEASQRYGTTESQLAMMRNQITNAGIDIGTALLPVIRDGIELIAGLARKFNELDPNVKKAISYTLLLVTGISILLTAVGALGLAISGCSIVLGAFGAIVGFIFSPLGFIVLGVTAVHGAVFLLKQAWDTNWNGIKDKTLEICDKVKNAWNGLREWFFNNPIVATVTEAWNKVTGKNKSKDPRNAFGSGRIARNDELRRLHEGEKVLSRGEADRYEKGLGQSSSVIVNVHGLTVREEADIDRIANAFVRKLNQGRIVVGGAY